MHKRKKKKDRRQGKRKEKNSQSQFDFEDIEIYISRLGQYPSLILVKALAARRNLNKLPKKCKIKDGHLYHGEKLVIKEIDRQVEIIGDIHKDIIVILIYLNFA